MTRKQLLIGLIVLIAIVLAVIFVPKNKEEKTNPAVLSVSAFNQTKNSIAEDAPANPDDLVTYTLRAENPTDEVISGYVVEAKIQDLSELATLTDASGANFNSNTNFLVWTPLDIPAKGYIEKTFTVQVKPEIPADSDGVMTVEFNNQVQVAVNKQTAGAVQPMQPIQPSNSGLISGTSNNYSAPSTGSALTIVIWASVLVTAALFAWRQKALTKSR